MIYAYAQLWLDHPSLGCGWRAVVIADVGRKWAKAVEPVSGTVIRIEKAELREAKPVERPRWRRIADQLQRARRNAQAYGRRVPHGLLKRVEADARRMPA